MTRHALSVLALLFLGAACQNVSVEEAVQVTVAQFDPAPVSPDADHPVLPAIPKPSDLLMAPDPDKNALMRIAFPLQVALTVLGQDEPLVVDAFTTDAAEQLVETYLNTLHGFPTDGGTATSFSGRRIETDPAKDSPITSETVYVLDITGLLRPDTGIPVARVAGFQLLAGPTDDENGITPLSILPPAGQEWQQGRTYAAVVTSGITDEMGDPIRSAYAFNFIKSITPLEKDGRSVCALPDATAVQLETLRLAFAPIFDWLAGDAAGDEKIGRGDIALLWTFSIRPESIVLNDPTRNLFPTPNDIVKTSAAGSQHDCDGNGKPDCIEGNLCFPVDCENDTPVQKAFFQYMNALDGWPASMALSASFSLPVDPATVTSDTVKLQKIGAATPETVFLSLDSSATTLTIVPEGGYEAGASYAAAITTGVMTAGGTFPVTPSTITAVSRLTVPVAVDGKSQLTDLGVADADAVLLEAIRQGIQALIAAAGLADIAPSLAGIWGFTIQSHNEAIFDPTTGTVPFPNDVLMSLDEGGKPVKVAIPVNPAWPDSQKDIVAELNRLDGFSPLAATRTQFLRPLDESSFKWLGAMTDIMGGKGLGDISLGMADVTEVDPAQGVSGMMSLMKPENIYTDGEVRATFENGSLTVRPTGGYPLQAGRRYMLLAFNNAKSKDKGQDGLPLPIEVAPVFFMARSPDPLVDDAGKSNLLTLSDADAQQLEMLRVNYNSIFAALESDMVGVSRDQVLMFWTYTTQTIGTWLVNVVKAELDKHTIGDDPQGSVAEAETAAPDLKHADKVVLEGGHFVAFSALAAPDPAAGNFGRMKISESGVPDFTQYSLPFILALPKEDYYQEPKTQLPLVVLQHGLDGTKEGTLSQFEPFLAAGYAVLAIDLPYHGQRKLPGMENGVPFFSADAVATRDHIVQSALDIYQAIRFAGGTSKNGLNDWLCAKNVVCITTRDGKQVGPIDVNRIYFVGESLGGIAGTLTLAMTEAVDQAALVATGGHLTRILQETGNEGFRKPIEDALAAMGYVKGTPEYAQFMDTAQMLLDRGDPVNYARHLVSSPLVGDKKKLFIGMAETDDFIPHAATRELACAARDGVQPYFKEYPVECHGFFYHRCDGGAGADPGAKATVDDILAFFAQGGDGSKIADATSGESLPCDNL
ncbi:MAG: hypothetical protein FJ109_01045 [Deltaproteobacteria bacterium]|nr:hypothetical protein [Deltaproteobacteria bacterium]